MRAVGEATRCKVKEKVERALTTIAQLMTGWAEKVEKEKEEKNKERDFRSGSWDPGGGGGRGGDALRARAPRGQVPSALPPFPFSPSLPPEGGSPPFKGFAILLNGTLTSSFVKKLKRHTPSLILVLSYTLFTLKGGEGKIKIGFLKPLSLIFLSSNLNLFTLGEGWNWNHISQTP
jgi:hypothetical protein